MRSTVYLASDMHFGAPSPDASRERESRFIAWLDSVAHDMAALYLVGDLFDYWFEYQHVVPRGYVRLLGKLAALVDSGVEVHLFPGNHDLWYGDFFEREIGVKVHQQPLYVTLHGFPCYIAHGDGLGPGDHGYKALKALFTNPLAQWGFRHLLHPDLGARMATYFSSFGWKKKDAGEPPFFGEKEFLYQHVQTLQQQHPELRYCFFGHRHLARVTPIGTAEMFYLGDWVTLFTFAKITPQGAELGRTLV